MLRQTVLVLSCFSACSIYAASFDCQLAKTSIETMICDSAAISELDNQLALLYTPVSDVEGVREKQQAWIKRRNQCDSESCLKQSYKTQINTMTQTLFGDAEDLPTPESLNGDWSVVDATQNNGGSLTIENANDTQLKFSAQFFAGANSRTIEGTALFANPRLAFYTDKDDGKAIPCTAMIYIAKDGITVSSNDSCDHADMVGTLFHKTSAHDKPASVIDLTQSGLLPSKNRETEFKSLVGTHYKDFIDSIDVVSDEPANDHNHFKTSFVRGIANQQACAVMYDADSIWAAVLNAEKEQIHYFTNAPEGSRAMPKPMQDWVEATQPSWKIITN
jgi:uncharacterized protein